jgi:cytochrome c2
MQGMKGNTMRFGWKTLVAAPVLALIATTAVAGDAENGEKVFKKCKACHKIGEGATNGTGPALTGVIGRTAGTAADFSYSDGMVAAGTGGLVWTEEAVTAYIEDPSGYLKEVTGDSSAKSKMTFKLKKESDREDVAAYLSTFSDPVEPAEGTEESSD